MKQWNIPWLLWIAGGLRFKAGHMATKDLMLKLIVVHGDFEVGNENFTGKILEFVIHYPQNIYKILRIHPLIFKEAVYNDRYIVGWCWRIWCNVC